MLFFRKEKSGPKSIKIKPSELKEEYQNLVGDLLNEFESEISKIFSSIDESKKQIAENLEELKEAELKNNKIPEKEKHFMEGNRLAYIKAVEIFLSKLEEPEEFSDEEIEEFLEHYKTDAETFKKASFRPGQISSQFFGEDLKKIGILLNSIDKGCKNISSLMKSENIQTISAMKEKIRMLDKEIQKNEILLKEIEKSELKYEDLKKEKAVFEQRIKKIENNSDFLNLNEMREKLKKAREDIKILDASFIDSFLQIEKGLKKLSKSSEEDSFVSKYIEDPVNAVINDSTLKIFDIINKTKDSLESGAIEMDEKKKGKLIEKISSLKKEMFTEFIIKHNDLTLKINDCNRRIHNNNSQRDLDDARYKMDHVQQKQETAGEHIKKMNKQLEDLKIEDYKTEIEEGFEKLNIKLEIEI